MSSDDDLENTNAVVSELLAHVADPSGDVKDSIHAALIHLSMKHSKVVISQCHSILRDQLANNILDVSDLTVLLNIMDRVIRDQEDVLKDSNLLNDIIPTMFDLLKQKTHNCEELSKITTNIVVILSSLFCREIMELLLCIKPIESKLSENMLGLFAHRIMHILPVLLSQTPKMAPTSIEYSTESLLTTLGKYCDASLEYLASVADSESSWDLLVDLLSPHADAAIGFILISLGPFNREHQPALSSLAPVGSIMSLSSVTYLEEHLPKLLDRLASQLKKPTSSWELSVIHSFNVLFDACSRRFPCRKAQSRVSNLIQDELNHLLPAFFNRLSLANRALSHPGSTDSIPLASKLVNEFKRTFAILCTSFPKCVLNFVHTQLVTGSDWSRTTTLSLLRHLVASCTESCFDTDMRRSILSNVQHVLHATSSLPTARPGSRSLNLIGTMVASSPLSSSESSMILGDIASGVQLSNGVRYELAKIILTLGSQSYLEELTQTSCSLVEFIVRQCAMPLSASTKSVQSPTQREIRKLCEHVLKLSSSTVPSMHRVLWPFVVEFIMRADCAEAVGPVCDCIANIVSRALENLKDRSTEISIADSSYFDALNLTAPNVEPVPLLARLMVLLGLPIRGTMRGLPILRVLHGLAHYFHSSLPSFWEVVIPRMIVYLTQGSPETEEEPPLVQLSPESFSQEHWESLTLKMLSRSLERVNTESWTLQLLRAFESQMSLYDGDVEEKAILLKCIGVVLRWLTSDPVVTESLDFVFQSTNHLADLEQQACSFVVGCISETHQQLTLNYLRQKQLKSENDASPNDPGELSKSRRFSSLFRSSTRQNKSGSDDSAVKALDAMQGTLIQSHGQLLPRIDQEHVADYLDELIATILPNFLHFAHESRQTQFALVTLIGQIARSLHTQSGDVDDVLNERLKRWTKAFSSLLMELLTPGISSMDSQPMTAPISFVGHITGQLKDDLSCTADPQLRLSILTTLLDVLTLRFPGCDGQLYACLVATAAAGLILPDEDLQAAHSRTKLKRAFERSAVKSQVSQPASGPQEVFTALQRLWTELITQAFSVDLVHHMLLIAVSYLHGNVHQVVRQALRLLHSVLAATYRELRLIKNTGVPLEFSARLVGHLTVLLGHSYSHSLRQEAKCCLAQLLFIQNLFCVDREYAEHDDDDGIVCNDNLDKHSLPSHVLLCLHARRVHRSQLMGLFELLLSNSFLNLSSGLDAEQEETGQLSDIESSSVGGAHDLGVSRGVPTRFEQMIKSNSALPVEFFASLNREHTAEDAVNRLISGLHIPPSSQGYAVRLLVCLTIHWAEKLTEEEVRLALRWIHRIYSQINDPGLRTGLVQAVAQLGSPWISLCIQHICANPLPLDETWTAFLSAIAFRPVCDTLPGPRTSARRPKREVDQSALPHLLSHILQSLDRCQPYEQRTIPVQVTQKTARSLSGEDSSVLETANFATHFWLSSINCLQVFSAPITMQDRLTATGYSAEPSFESKKLNLIFMRTRKQPQTDSPRSNCSFLDGSSHLISLCEHLTEPTLFSRLLGHWMLACATASICRALSGKSYESRSGAEANLQYGVEPVSIAVKGIVGFLRSCDLLELVDLVKACLHRGKTQTQDDSSSGISEYGANLYESECLAEFVNIIVNYLTNRLKPIYTVQLVQFYLAHMNSTMDVRRRLAYLVLIAALSQLQGLCDSQTATRTISTEDSLDPDLLLDGLIRRLDEESHPALRLLLIEGLGHIVPRAEELDGEQKEKRSDSPDELETTCRFDLRIWLFGKHGCRIVESLLRVVNTQNDVDSPLLLASLETLITVLSCMTEHQISPLMSRIFHQLLSLYTCSNSSVRLASFTSFHRLTRFAYNQSHLSFELVQGESSSMFVTLLLYLADPSEAVVQVCKAALTQISSLLWVESSSDEESPEAGHNRIAHFFHTCLRPEMRLHLGEFYNELAKLLVSLQPESVVDHITRCTVFFRSDLQSIQCSALMLSSSLFGYFAKEQIPSSLRAQLCEEYKALFKSPHSAVRATCAHAMSRLH